MTRQFAVNRDGRRPGCICQALTLGTGALFVAVGGTAIAYGATPNLYLAAGLITIGSIACLALVPSAVGA